MDSEDFDKIVLPLKVMLQRHALKFLLEEQQVDDVVQETFIKLWEIRDGLENHPNLKGLSVQILKNLCRNQLKANARFESIDHSSTSFSTDDTHLIEVRDELNEILKLIESFPPLQRKVFRMKHIEGYEVDEIALILKSTKESVRMHLSRGRRINLINDYNGKNTC